MISCTMEYVHHCGTKYTFQCARHMPIPGLSTHGTITIVPPIKPLLVTLHMGIIVPLKMSVSEPHNISILLPQITPNKVPNV